MDIKDAEDQLDKADSFLDKLWKLLGKHWGKLLIILLCYGIYRFGLAISKEMDKPDQEQVEQVQQPNVEPTITDQFYLIDENNDTSIIRNWTDGSIDTIGINE